MVQLVGAGLLIRSLRNLENTPLDASTYLLVVAGVALVALVAVMYCQSSRQRGPNLRLAGGMILVRIESKAIQPIFLKDCAG